MQTGEELIENLFLIRQQNQNASARLKEQIDQLMGEEISKTIESMQLYIDRVNAVQNKEDYLSKHNIDSNVGKSDRLKKQIQNLRNDIEDGSRQLSQELEENRFKQQLQHTKTSIKEAAKDQSPKEKEKFPAI